MFLSGDYLHPVYMGIEHYHKPPMTYWITSLAYHLLGVSPFSARFFLQLAFLLQLLLIYRITSLLYSDRKIAVSAVFIYASFMLVWISVRNLTTDAYLNTFLLLTTWSIVSYLYNERILFLYLAAIFIALAFLTKITAVFVFTGSLLLFILAKLRNKIKWSWHLLWAGLLAMLISGSWFYLLQLEGKPVLKYMLYDQSVIRYTSDTFQRSMPWYFYFAAGSLLSFPWFFITLTRIFNKIRMKPPSFTVALFILCFLLPLLFFSLSHSKLLLYILPAFWSLAIIGGKQLSEMQNETLRIWLRVQSIWIILIGASLLILPVADSQYRLSVAIIVILLAAMAGLIFIYLKRSITLREKLLFMPLVFTISLVLISTHFLSDNEENSSTGKIAAQWIIRKNMDNLPVFIYDKLAPSFAFHLDTEIILIGKKEKRELQFEESEDWKNHYYDLNDPLRKEELLKALQNPSLLIARSRRIAEIDPDLLEVYPEKHQTGLWTIFYK